MRSAGCGASTAGLKSLFVGFRFHDLRHQAAEFKASDQTILSIAGHVVKRTTPPTYAWKALDAIDDGTAEGRRCRARNQALRHKPRHKFPEHLDSMAQVIDSIILMVELSGIEPLTSSLRTRRSPN